MNRRSCHLLLLAVLVATSAMIVGCSDKETNPPQDVDSCAVWEGELQESHTRQDLMDLQFVNPSLAYAVGGGGTIVATTDGGQTWRTLTSGAAINFYGLHFWSPDSGWLVGADGAFWQTTDSGGSWTHKVITGKTLTGVHHFDYWHSWVVGDGVIMRSTDGGTSWDAYKPPSIQVVPWLWDLAMVDDKWGYAVGTYDAQAKILKTDDGGDNWVARTSPAIYPLFGVDFVDRMNGWVVGLGGTLIGTSDGSQHWTKYSLPIASVLRGVDFWDLRTGMVVGDAGVAYVTEDGGAHWSDVFTGVASNLWRVAMVSPTTAYICGDDGVILKVTRSLEPCE